MPLLRARDVVKSFAGHRVLDGVSLEVSEAEVVGIVGPNGAGKTTLIRVLLGLLRRDSGIVELMGRDPFRDPRARRGVGVVFERPVMPAGLTVVEFLEYAASILGVPAGRVDWAIRASGLERHEHKFFNQLSAGLKQRAALAHALLAKPRLVVADEPTSNLDPVERVRILDTISGLARGEGVAFLLTSHVLHEIVRVADRVVILYSGRVVASGSIDEVSSMIGRIVRIRTPIPDRLAEHLRASGFKAEVRGLSVIVRLGEGGAGGLLRTLADIVDHVQVYDIDFVEAGLEEVLGRVGEAA
ncbi:MAG: ABC transporter ATP-binding protein [Desulfurococcales archaeon]|nr:ABC transporter ATP-binding protein [Desulfurococcales archaeon]